jgi:hypothetical protein
MTPQMSWENTWCVCVCVFVCVCACMCSTCIVCCSVHGQ